MTDLLSLTYEELSVFVSEALGEKPYRTKQIFSALHKGSEISDISTLSKSLREKIASLATADFPKVEQKQVSKDGTVKYLFMLADGQCVESVLMKYKHGNTICISSQVGCNMGCVFCASCVGGKARDLTAGELIGQIISAERDSGERISNIVMMGIGEPLDNFENVKKFLSIVSDPNGINIGQRHISLSTCGLCNRIRELADLDLGITLSVSLHASTDEQRSAIMPVNRKYNLAELMEACKYYYNATHRRISFEYTLISGKNDSQKDAVLLANLLNKGLRRGTDMPIHVNLIRLNEARSGLSAPDIARVNSFCSILEKNGISATVRRKLGADINAACGELRAVKNKTTL